MVAVLLGNNRMVVAPDKNRSLAYFGRLDNLIRLVTRC